MSKFLVLFRRNPVAPFPSYFEESLKFFEKVWATIDDLIKKGEITEMGTFLDGVSGYIIAEGDSVTTLKNVSMFTPFWNFEVHEIVPYPKSREIFTGIMKGRIESTKK